MESGRLCGQASAITTCQAESKVIVASIVVCRTATKLSDSGNNVINHMLMHILNITAWTRPRNLCDNNFWVTTVPERSQSHLSYTTNCCKAP